MKNPFRYFKTSPEIIRLAVMMYVRFPLSLRNVEDLLHERGIEVSHETIRFWWNRFGPIFAAEIRKKRMDRMHAFSGWRWHLDEMFVKSNGEGHYLWRAVDQEGEVLEAFVSKKRDREAALKFLRKLMKRYGRPDAIITDRLRSYRAALRELGGSGLQQAGREGSGWSMMVRCLDVTAARATFSGSTKCANTVVKFSPPDGTCSMNVKPTGVTTTLMSPPASFPKLPCSKEGRHCHVKCSNLDLVISV